MEPHGNSLRYVLGAPTNHPLWLCDKKRMRVMQDVAAAGRFFHDVGVAHCDLKALNVLVGSVEPGGFCARVTDFGSAVSLQDAANGSGPSGAEARALRIESTLSCMAPELLLRGAEPGAEPDLKAADVYAFGVLLAELWSERYVHPFEDRIGKDTAGYKYRICCERWRPKPPARARPAIQQLMQRCWAHEPNDRPTFDQISDLVAAALQETEPGGVEA